MVRLESMSFPKAAERTQQRQPTPHLKACNRKKAGAAAAYLIAQGKLELQELCNKEMAAAQCYGLWIHVAVTRIWCKFPLLGSCSCFRVPFPLQSIMIQTFVLSETVYSVWIKRNNPIHYLPFYWTLFYRKTAGQKVEYTASYPTATRSRSRGINPERPTKHPYHLATHLPCLLNCYSFLLT